MAKPFSDVGVFVRNLIKTTQLTNTEIATDVMTNFPQRTFDAAKLRQFVANIRYQNKKAAQVIE